MGAHQASWSNDDLAALKEMIDAGMAIPEIARTLGRTQEATSVRARREGWHAYPSRHFTGQVPDRP